MKKRTIREGRVAIAVDELYQALGAFEEEELRALAPYVEVNTVESIIWQLQQIIEQ